VPTKHSRIAVTLDEELAEALARVEALDRGNVSRARRLRDLALRGAESVVREEEIRQEKLERLAELSTQPDWLDHEALLRVREEAWGE
jgi:hypothetical protein